MRTALEKMPVHNCLMNWIWRLLGTMIMAEMSNLGTPSLEQLEQRFRATVEAAPTAMVMIDKTGQIVLVNAETENLFGYSRNELLGQSVEILVPEKFRAEHPEHRTGFFANPAARRMGEGRDLYGLRKDGTEIPVELGLNPVETDEGLFVLSAIVDITERKRSELKMRQANAALEQLEQRFRATVEAAPTAMVMIDKTGQIVLVNTETENLFGYSRDELLGQSVEILVPVEFRAQHPEHRTGFFANPAARRMGEGRDLYGLRKDGTEIPVELGLNPVETNEGLFVLSAIVDITERKRSELKMRQANAALEQSNTELEQFAYVASHDLQEPLRKISSYAQLLQEECGAEINQDGHEYLDIMMNGARRLKVLIADLLSFSRITTRGNPLGPTNSNSCLEEAIENLEIAIKENNAEVTYDKLPTVVADASQLVLLFQNLVGNAIKYRGEDTPKVHIGGKNSGHHFEFSIRDNGIGIEQEFYDRVFQIFQRLHNRREYTGTGIGLAICKRIVERFGGSIWIESSPGSGSTFFFSLDRVNLRKANDDCHTPKRDSTSSSD